MIVTTALALGSLESHKKCDLCYEENEVNCQGWQNNLVICDNCDRGFHTNCHNPPIDLNEHTGDWFCSECQGEEKGKLTIENLMKDEDMGEREEELVGQTI